MTNSIQKGKRAERLFSAALRLLGFTARRGQQFSGSPDSPDVVTNIDGIHFEVKHVEALNIWGALAQAEKDAGTAIPVVAFKRNRTPWYLALPLEDLLEFSEQINTSKKHEEEIHESVS
jgi:Holliday junction resolvase